MQNDPSQRSKKRYKKGVILMAIKEGDKVRISLIEEDYRVKWVGDRMVVLEAENKSRQFLTTMDNLKTSCSPRDPKMKERLPVEEKN
jgi:hypothetical protein